MASYGLAGDIDDLDLDPKPVRAGGLQGKGSSGQAGASTLSRGGSGFGAQRPAHGLEAELDYAPASRQQQQQQPRIGQQPRSGQLGLEAEVASLGGGRGQGGIGRRNAEDDPDPPRMGRGAPAAPRHGLEAELQEDNDPPLVLELQAARKHGSASLGGWGGDAPPGGRGGAGSWGGAQLDQQFGFEAEARDDARNKPVYRVQQGRDGLDPSSSRLAPAQFDRQADVMTRRKGLPMDENEAATRIQNAYRAYSMRRKGGAHLVRTRIGGQQQQQPPGMPPPGTMNIKLPAVPVIDVNKLPRYGILAPPMERPERHAGKYVDYDRATQIFVKNRGALREEMDAKPGFFEDGPVRMWSQFTARQKDRYVPIPPDANRRVLPETQGYRLRILRVNDLPLNTTYDGRTFEFQLGVSLYDEAYGTFYGNTVHSMSDAYDRNRAAQRNSIDLDFSFDVYYHTTVSDPRCMAVVEIIMLERMLDGVVKGEYSLGWALLPLFRVSGPVPGAPAGVALDPQPGKPLAVPLVSGTPRYLLFRNVYNEDLRPPKVIPNCSILFQAEAYPAMDAYIPLLPENFLVTYSDVIPGLRRFDTAGQLAITTKTVISTVASPMLSPTYSVVLRRLQIALPAKLHELLLTLDAKRPQAIIPNMPDMPGVQQYDQPMLGLCYTVRVAVHNGRTFVGPAYDLINVTQLDVPGWKVLQIPAPDAVFDYVMGDVLVTIVVELLAAPPQVLHNELLPPVQYSLGWTAFVPFSYMSDDGSEAEVAVGVHRYPLLGKQNLIREQPVLDWRALMGDGMNHDVPDPLVEFQLFETGRTPIPPPLRSKFTIIEHQREEEAAMGEQPLEQVLAPVPVPPEIAPEYPPDLEHPEMSLEPVMLPQELGGDGGVLYEPELPSILKQRQQAMHDEMYGPAAQAERDQLRDLAEAMQRQLSLLTRAVEELKDERKSLRNSVLALVDQPGRGGGDQMDPRRSRQSPGHPSSDEIRRLMDMPATTDLGDPGAFSGGPAPVPGGPGAVPSRLLMQQLYDAGMLEGLPEDVQALLRRRGGPRGPPGAALDLTIEARDPRTASDVVFQFLAYRHHDTLNAPVNIQSLYFTFQFYHFAPTTTVMAYLVQPNPAHLTVRNLDVDGHDTTERGAPAPDPTTVNATRILVTNHPTRKGAGVTVKYIVDASLDALPTGQSVAQAALEGAMHFAQYLAAKTLSIDVWDGESLLQVGTATINLQGLLRQGRDFAELLVEVPIMDNSDALPDALLVQPARTPNDATTPTVLSKGSLVLRVINIGREPRNASQRLPEPQKAAGRKVRVRARPAWTIKGPISKELANGQYESLMHDADPGSPGYAARQQAQHAQQGEQFLSDLDELGRAGKRRMPQDPRVLSPPRQPGSVPFGSPGGRGSPGRGRPGSPGAGDHGGTTYVPSGRQLPEEVKMHILEKEHHKSTRLGVLQEVLTSLTDDESDLPQVGNVPGTGAGNGGPREAEYRRVQKQLLTDVSSVRTRQKDAVIKDQLRRNMVIHRVIRPGYGEVVVYEHEFVNPYGKEMVFEVHISTPTELSVITRMDEYRALRAANARFFGTPTQPVGHLEQELMAGNRVYLQAHEHITLPFKLQSFEPPEGYLAPRGAAMQAPSDGSVAADALRRSASQPNLPQTAAQVAAQAAGGQQQSSGSDQGHVVTVELVSVERDHPVLVLELQVVPRPLIIDRTFRFYQPEFSLMRQTVKMKALPGADTTFAGGALRNLAVACSHPDIIVGAGSSGLVSGSNERDEVYVKYKCGGAPEVTHFYVLLYLDRLLARPVEIWQVFAHCLRKVDMRAVIGQTSQASVVVRGAHSTRRVACYSSHPDELQVAPTSFVLVAGSLSELLLSFRPVTQGLRDIKVHLVDTETRELVYALIVCAEAQGPLITRTFEVEVPCGTVGNKKIMYTNPYNSYRTFTLRSNQPWLVHFTPPRLQLPAGATRPLGLTFDARAATTGILDVLVFVNDEEDKTEECFKVRVRIYR